MFSLHVDTARGWRGEQSLVLHTVLGLRALGHRAVLVAHPDGELGRRMSEGHDLVPLAPRGEVDLSLAWQLSRVLKRLTPDVIHAYGPISSDTSSWPASAPMRWSSPRRSTYSP